RRFQRLFGEHLVNGLVLPEVAAPLAGYTLIFGAGATQKTANNNFPSGTLFAAVCFQDSGYTITGNSLKLSAGISSACYKGITTLSAGVVDVQSPAAL